MPNPVAQLLDAMSSTLAALREALSSAETPVKATRGKKVTRTTAKRLTKPAASPTAPVPETAAPRAPKKAKVPSARLAFQGQYMSAIRGLSAANKAKVKKVLAADGVEAAIALALSKKKG